MGFTFSTGDGVVGITPYRLAAVWDMGPLAYQGNPWQLDWTWEASAAYWKSKKVANSPRYLTVLATGPQLRLIRQEPFSNGWRPYWEAGIGASWLSKKEIGGRTLGMHFQFEDRLGFGLRFNSTYDGNVRIVHYSNASLSDHNSGVNLLLLTLGMWF
jgi:lipid A 3-O-deacylase